MNHQRNSDNICNNKDGQADDELKRKKKYVLSDYDAVLCDDTCRNFVKVIFPIRPLRYYVIVILSQSQWLNMHEVNNHTITIIQTIGS